MNSVYQEIFNVEPNTNYEVIVKCQPNSNFLNDIVTIEILEDDNFGKIHISTPEHKFKYYNGNNDKITIKCNCREKIQIKISESPLKIDQIYMNKILSMTFMEDMIKVYGLNAYHDDYSPAIFYGIQTNEELEVLKRNKSLKIIVWIGGDINHDMIGSRGRKTVVYNKISTINNLTKIRHIAISSFIKKSLTLLSVPHISIPFMGVNFDNFKPITKGPCIYLYTTLLNENCYGHDYYVRLMEKYPDIKFIVTCCKFFYKKTVRNKMPLKYGITNYNKKDLVTKIYPQCFIGLRLTKHDGLAATVQELGLLGIKTIHNGCSPSSLNYSTFEDICTHIDNERKKIGTIDYETANTVKEYLSLDKNFFSTTYYKTLEK
jgi:hypothetical protein